MTPSANFGRLRLARHRLEGLATRLRQGRCTCAFAAREIARIQVELDDIDADLDSQPEVSATGNRDAEAVHV